jgi:1-acyl-sn-glycerol-3-phosphate acyltransferase
MSTGWAPPPEPPAVRITAAGWLRVIRRGVPMAVVVFGGLVVLLALRLVERPLYGLHRPLTPRITQGVCRAALMILGLRYEVRGARMHERGAVVSNHASWLDIFVLNAGKRVYFVSKSEVARWPLIGWLARATGTVFIDRDPRAARGHTALFVARLMAGHKLLFFPEGTSTDGRVVLPFKPTLFEAFFSAGLREALHVQPVTLIYHAPDGAEPRFYGWWGEMDFAHHLLKVLAAPRQGRVEVVYHPPVRVADFRDRKALAAHVEAAVRAGMPPDRRARPG